MVSDLFDFELRAVVEKLEERVKELEERLDRLENSTTAPGSIPAPRPATANLEKLVETVRTALEILGEGDTGLIRTKVVELGMLAATKSDVNKALYANPKLFKVDHSEGVKPIWKLNTDYGA